MNEYMVIVSFSSCLACVAAAAASLWRLTIATNTNVPSYVSTLFHRLSGRTGTCAWCGVLVWVVAPRCWVCHRLHRETGS